MTAHSSDKLIIFDQKLLEEKLYWAEKLSQEVEPSNLRLDFSRPVEYSGNVNAVEINLDEDLYLKLIQLTAGGPFLLYTTLMAALKVCIHKYTGSTCIVVGSPTRRQEGGSSHSENVLAIVDNFNPRTSFKEFLMGVRQTLLDAYSKQNYPFYRLIKDLSLDEIANKCPLFDVALELTNIHSQMPSVMNDITLTFTKETNRIHGRALFNTALFKKETVERFANHFLNALTAGLKEPNTAIRDLRILSQEERQFLLDVCNDTKVDYQTGLCVHTLFETQAELMPEATAIVFDDQGLSYRELNRRANQLAHYLRSKGVGPEVLVGLCVERGIGMVIGTLGVLKSGGAYVPMDTAYPPDRLAFLLEDSNVKVLITERSVQDVLPEHGAYEIALDTDWEEIASHSETNPQTLASSQNLAYVIYTSGSTGTPKGVGIQHASLMNLLFWHQRVYQVSSLDRATQVAGLAFDASVWEVWPYLTAGASLHIPDHQTHASPERLVRWLNQKQITISFLPTPMAEAVMEQEWGEGRSLRMLLTGGDRLHRGAEEGASYRLMNNYGPTESTVVATWTEVRRGERGEGPPIGKPIDNARVYVVGREKEVAPIGVGGEILIGGAGVGRGYERRAEMTAERFVPDCVSGEEGRRLYRTGDLGRYLSDGNIEFLGRIDQQVKLRGYRIELGEIESVLAQHATVAEAIVSCREDEPGRQYLVAYVVPDKQRGADVNDLRNFLKTRLPDYMVPVAFVIIESFPLSPNGKIDRKALPPPGSYRSETERVHLAPNTPTQELVAGIWMQILGLRQVGIDENFFELGGHSLLATQVTSRVREAFEVELPLRILFEGPTVTSLADKIDEAIRVGKGLQSTPIEQVSRDQLLPLSFAQQRLWFIDQLAPGNSVYNFSSAMRLKGNLDVTALERSINEIVRRHEVLRTSFALIDGRAVQMIEPELKVGFPTVDLTDFPVSERESRCMEVARTEARRPFDLSRGPLLRLMLLKLDEQDHVALLTMHHIITDGWSIGVFISEVATLYEAFSAGRRSPLEELPIQYADYAKWQREWLRGRVLEAEFAYWEKQLADAPALLELPTDRPRPAIKTYNSANEKFTVPRALSEKLSRLSRQEDVTLFMTLLAAYQILLHRYSGKDDICVGSPIANRNREEIEGLIGFFVNLLVLRTRFDASVTFRELLVRVREVALGAYAHQDMPFEQLVDAMQPERSLSHTPLVQATFTFHNTPNQPLVLSELTLSPVEIDTGSVEFDLSLIMGGEAEGLAGFIVYNSDLFDARTIKQMAAHFLKVMEEMVSDLDLRVSTFPLLTEAERRQLIEEWNQTEVPYQTDQCVHQAFEYQETQTPDALAVICDDGAFSYRGLNRRANQVAHFLKGLGVGPEVCVAVCMQRSAQTVVALLGVLKAGGAYVPIDPASPAERLSFLLEDTMSPVLLTQESVLDNLPAYWGQVVCLDTDWKEIASHSETNPQNLASSQNLAYVIYTSGSTGTPKGVGIQHASLMNLLFWHQRVYQVSSLDRATQVAGLAFDASVWEVWPYLTAGASLHIPDHQTHSSPERLVRWLNQKQITISFLPTPMAEAVMEQEWGEGRSLRMLLTGGDRLHRGAEEGASYRLMNNYGPTESTVVATWTEVRRGERGEGPPIGKPIDNARVYVVDREKEVAPIGVGGEILIGGAGVGRGYERRAEMTAERFVPDCVSGEEGRRLYRTGDLGRYLSDGNIEFLGRIDQQVKVRGFRIELGEIETALGRHPKLRAVVVTSIGESSGEKRLIAYIVADPEDCPTVTELRQFVTKRLPEYMVPASFVFLEELPLNSSGKVDRAVLPLPDHSRPNLEKDFVAPRTHAEAILADVWAEVLEVDRIGVHDSFFDLGGDSITSVQVIAKAQEKGVNVSIQQLFKSPTIHDLAGAIEPAQVDVEADEPLAPFSLLSQEDQPKMPDWAEDAYPVTRMQSSMLFHTELDPDTAIYHDIASLHIQSPLDIESFEEALRRVVARHPILRTSFNLADYSEPLQFVHHRAIMPLEFEDLSDISDEEQEQRVAAVIDAERDWRFDWSEPPLMRLLIHKRSRETFQLTLSFHHAIFDGWSLGLMLTELFQSYISLREGGHIAIEPAPRSSFRDLVVLEREALASDEARLYWKQRLADATLTRLPRWDVSSKRSESPKAGVQVVTIPTEVFSGLKEVARKANVPLKSVLVAAHLRVMSFLSGQQEVLTGLVVHGRPETSDGERILGLFLNTLPLRQKLSGGTWIELAEQTFEAEQEMMAYRRYPYAQIVKDCGNQPLFETALNFVHFHVYRGLQGVSNLQLLGAKGFEQNSLTLLTNMALDVSASQLNVILHCNAAEINEEQIDAICKYYERTLSAMAGEPSARYEYLSLLSPREQVRILKEWNATSKVFPADSCIHELFESQVESTPHEIAIVFEGECLTYSDLNRRSNKIAHHLRGTGVLPGDLVGLCVERCIDMVAGLLGILKAGAAYLPLDPAHPKARLAMVLEDAGRPVVVTHQRFFDDLKDLAAQVVTLDSRFTSAGDDNPKSGQVAESLAYTIFTSGSTGRPKGVQVPHKAVVNFLNSMRHQPGMTGRDVIVAVTTLSFDIAALELLLPLVLGARVVIASREVASDATALMETMESCGATVMQATPALWRMLVEAGWEGDSGLKILCGGEALPLDLSEELLKKGASLWNMYGPTETTIWSAVERVDTGALSIGQPIDNTRIYLLDDFQQPVPVGVAGELYIGGEGLAWGYLSQPAMTAERFTPDPFSNVAGARLYRTGDLACFHPDGKIECQGRIDHQVKLRGYRIELGEIETVIGQHPAVRHCVVMASEDLPGQKRLVAYLTHEGDDRNLISDLRNYLKERLPDYMVPSVFMAMESLPLTPNGKIDRRALPAPDSGRDQLGVEYIAPRGAEEEMLAGIWGKLLGIEKIGVFDNFFELGGHSLLAMLVISHVRKTFEVEIPLRRLFEKPTIADLASLIRAARLDDESPSIPPLLPVLRDGELPLSFAQQRLWFIDQLMPDNPAYNIFKALRLSGPLNLDALLLSFDLIVSRHESLRTSFPSFAGRPSQLISPSLSFSLPLVDLSLLPEILREHEAIRIASQAAHLPFDLGLAPAWRASILRLDPNEHILLLTLHHIISDGWSIAVLLSELTTLYDAFSTGQPSPLSPLPIQYADYALWQRRLLEGERLETELEYWKRRLEGAPEGLELPTDRPRPAVQTNRGRIKEFGLSQELSVRLKEFSRTEGVTLFMTLLGGLEAMLHRYSGQDDIVVSTGVANRNRSETEKLIGCLINILLIRGRFDREKTVREMMREVREEVLGAYEHQEMPFEMLVEKMEPERDLSRHPMYQVMMVMLNLPPMEVGEMEGIKVRGMEVENRTSQSDLVIHVWEQGGKMRGTVQYNSDLFEERTVGRMMRSYEEVLRSMVEDPEVRVSKMRIMSEQEEREIVEEWNETREEMEREKTLVELFEEQAERRREAIAVIEGEREISYGEIEERANKVGNYLRKRGVKREERVGLMVERGIEMVIGMLGILKAGGGYVPMDPEYPEERLRYQMEETGAKVVMTQGRMMGEGKIGEKVMRGRRIVKIDEEWEEIERESGERPERGIGEDNLAYVIYTSGSTGRPKGVEMPHRQVVNFLRAMAQAPGLDCDDVVLAMTTLSFDPSVLELFLTLIVGARMVIVSRDKRTDTAAIIEIMQKREVTLVQSTPSIFRMLIEAGWKGSPRLKILCGGEMLTKDLAAQLRDRGASLWNLYGPTETTVWSTGSLIEDEANEITVGRPIANMRMYVLDGQGQPVPVGVAGELHVGGVGVGRGYYNRPDLTADKFIADPFSSKEGERIYRSGDLARFREDGAIEVLGRIDFQVKIRGHRIELGEIESVLKQHPAVKEAVVMANEYAPDDKRLVAYYLIEDSQAEPSVADLKNHMKEKLPDYMVPNYFLLLDHFPLSPNGKVDRKALPLPDQSRPESERAYVPPVGPEQETLASIWSQVLRVEKVGISDNFFNLGGHSLLATQAVALVRDAFQVDLNVRCIFEAPTVAEMAERVVALKEAQNGKQEKLAEAFEFLDSLSEDEIISLLEEKRLTS